MTFLLLILLDHPFLIYPFNLHHCCENTDFYACVMISIYLEKAARISRFLDSISILHVVSSLLFKGVTFNLLPFFYSLGNKRVENLVKTLESILTTYLKNLSSSGYRLKGERIKEVGRNIEGALVHEITRSLNANKLVTSGYPDIEILEAQNRVTYLEVKTSSVGERKSTYRYFYYTSGKKIQTHARHLLLVIFVMKEGPELWRIENCTLSDLSKLNLSLKSEFNASRDDLVDKKTQVFSTNP
jgi:hypothetical protein